MKNLIYELLRTDLSYLPNSVGECLYVRPTAMSFSHSLGVKRADRVKYFVILSPVKKYFAGPIHLAVCDSYDRGNELSANGFKLGANYAPTVAITSELNDQGISQALWLNNGNILESGATNIFFILKTKEGGK
jgi:branched-chain amino acid aminotransferase